MRKRQRELLEEVRAVVGLCVRRSIGSEDHPLKGNVPWTEAKCGAVIPVHAEAAEDLPGANNDLAYPCLLRVQAH